MAEEQNGIEVPYISFKTLTNLFERLEPEPPPRINKSVLTYLSGGYSLQVLSALRGLKLIDANGKPSEELVELVTLPSSRKETMGRVLRRTYASVFDSNDLTKATSGQLEEAFATYKLAGETKKKALVFFIKGAEYCEIPLSTLITTAKRMRTPGGSSQRKGGGRGKSGKSPDGSDRDPGGGSSGSGFKNQIDIHPMLQGAIQWLFENGDSWTQTQAETWTTNFKNSVLLVYPPKSGGQNGREAVSAQEETETLT